MSNKIFNSLSKNLKEYKIARQQTRETARQIKKCNNRVQNPKYSVLLLLQDGRVFPKSSAFIRLILPLTATGNVSVTIGNENNPIIAKKYDCVIVQRTAVPDEKTATAVIRACKQKNIPLIIDTDDFFRDIEKKHPDYVVLSERNKALESLLGYCDEAWFSTLNLQKNYSKSVQDKSTVIINSVDTDLWRLDDPTPRQPDTKYLKLLYMGTATHQADFDMIYPALKTLYEKYPNKVKLYVIGVGKEIPNETWIERIIQPKVIGAMYPNFVKWYRNLDTFDIGIAPLIDTTFNNSKSDIKALDYLCAYIQPYTSNTAPYSSSSEKDDLVLVNNTISAWKTELEKAVIDIDAFRARKDAGVQSALQRIKDKRNAKRIGLIQLERINGLLS